MFAVVINRNWNGEKENQSRQEGKRGHIKKKMLRASSEMGKIVVLSILLPTSIILWLWLKYSCI